MPVTETAVLAIVCDNPDCMGESGLDPSDRTGWTFVSAEVYGEPTLQYVYCCEGCAGTLGDVLAGRPAPPETPFPVPEPPVVPEAPTPEEA